MQEHEHETDNVKEREGTSRNAVRVVNTWFPGPKRVFCGVSYVILAYMNKYMNKLYVSVKLERECV